MSTFPNAYVTESPTPSSCTSPPHAVSSPPFPRRWTRVCRFSRFFSFERGSSARPGPFLPLRKKKKRRPAVKIINRKAYAVLSWLVRGCVRKRFDQGDPPSREEGRGCGVFSGSLKEESVKSQEFWRVARNIGQRASDKKKKEKKKGGGSGPRFATEPRVYVYGACSPLRVVHPYHDARSPLYDITMWKLFVEKRNFFSFVPQSLERTKSLEKMIFARD